MVKFESKQKTSQWTTLIIIDSQAVKNPWNASAASNGFCFYKATNGITGHWAGHNLGFPLFTHCPRANVTDNQGLIEMLSQNMDYVRHKPVDIAKTTILLDHGYHPDTIQQALELICAG